MGGYILFHPTYIILLRLHTYIFILYLAHIVCAVLILYEHSEQISQGKNIFLSRGDKPFKTIFAIKIRKHLIVWPVTRVLFAAAVTPTRTQHTVHIAGSNVKNRGTRLCSCSIFMINDRTVSRE